MEFSVEKGSFTANLIIIRQFKFFKTTNTGALTVVDLQENNFNLTYRSGVMATNTTHKATYAAK